MRYAPILFLVLALASCSRPKAFDAEAAKKWSQTADVQNRKKASSYSFQRPDASWVCVSTSQLTETDTGFVYSGGSILEVGYLVYPGGHNAKELSDAIHIASTIRSFQMKR